MNRYTEQLVADLFEEDAAVSMSTEAEGERKRDDDSLSKTSKKTGYSVLMTRIEAALQRMQSQTSAATFNGTGRLGGPMVVLDASTLVGNMQIDTDRLGLVGTSDFSTVRASCAVHSGKWMYEALLGTRGVMQFGWCTLDCQFSEEKGVGDTPRSYAYDGNRLRKWNMTTERYGEPWFAGDVIGCAIDLDAANISFYRNGRPLGLAFADVPVGPGIAYFPAFSLSLSETVRLNFGALPFLHPIPGYSPLQAAPTADNSVASRLVVVLERVLTQLLTYSSNPLLAQLASVAVRAKRDSEVPAVAQDPDATTQTPKARALLHLSAYHVLQHLANYFVSCSFHSSSLIIISEEDYYAVRDADYYQ